MDGQLTQVSDERLQPLELGGFAKGIELEDLDSNKQVAATIFQNVCVYFVNKQFNEKHEYSFCQWYTKYVHEVILHFLKNKSESFLLSLEHYTILRHNDQKKAALALFDVWCPPQFTHANLFETYAKFALVALDDSSHKTFDRDLIIEIISSRVVSNINENYEEARKIALSIMNCVFKLKDLDLRSFVTEPELKLGWNLIELTDSLKIIFSEVETFFMGAWSNVLNSNEIDLGVFQVCLIHLTQYPSCSDLSDFTVFFEYLLSICVLSLFSINKRFSSGVTYCIDKITIELIRGDFRALRERFNTHLQTDSF